jgi:DNA-binding transcriptional LysR family regulator
VKINLRNLEVFRFVVTLGSATAAAKALGVTQPAISRVLAQLEQSIGVPLFFRQKGRMHPTPEGLLLFDEVELAFDNLDRLAQLASSMRSLNVGQLRIVAPPSLAAGFLPEVMAAFMRQHPGVNMSIDSRSAETAKEMVAARVVDCGIGKLPMGHAGVGHEPFVSVGTVCVIPEGHALAAKKHITPEDLRGEPLVLLGQGRASRADLDAMFRQHGVTPFVRLEAHTVGTACACAAHGMGIAIVNGMMAQQFAHQGVALRRFHPGYVHELVFMVPAVMPRPRLTQAFFATCREHVQRRRKDYFVVDP